MSATAFVYLLRLASHSRFYGEKICSRSEQQKTQTSLRRSLSFIYLDTPTKIIISHTAKESLYYDIKVINLHPIKLKVIDSEAALISAWNGRAIRVVLTSYRRPFAVVSLVSARPEAKERRSISMSALVRTMLHRYVVCIHNNYGDHHS